MFMVIFEVPTWCLNNKQIKDRTYCDSDIYPNSGIPKIPHVASRVIEMFWLLILLFFTFFRRLFRLPSKFAKVREILQSILTALAVIDILIAIALDQGMWLSQPIRVILIVVFIRALREAIGRIALVIYDSVAIIVMVIGYVIVSGWIGYRLFRGTQEGEAYFPSLEEGIWSLTILITTANFPDVMLPAYTVNKAYAIFFVLYLVIGLFFLLNLVLAIFYSNYRNRIEQNLDKYEDKRERFLISKFEAYDNGNKGYLTQKECSEMFKKILKISKKKKVKHIVKTLKAKCNGKITKEAFINYFDFMELIQLEKRYDNAYVEKSRKRTGVARILQNPVYEFCMMIFVALNSMSIFAKDCMDLYGTTRGQTESWIFIEVVINWLFAIEMFLLFFWFGFVSALKRRNHLRFEIVFQITNLIFFIYFLATDRFDVITKALEITIILRMMRLLVLFKEVKQWQIIIKTIRALLSPFYTLLLVTYMLFLIYSIIGDRWFGGLSNFKEESIFRDDSFPNNYIQVNFNDLANSFMTLFILMVVNNWFVVWGVYETITGNTWCRIYFITFYFLSVIVVLNILIAFVIDMYSSVESLNTQESVQVEHDDNEDTM